MVGQKTERQVRPSNIVEQENVNEIETVRCIIERDGSILLLQKSPTSKAPLLYEFPGGKIDTIASAVSTLEEQAYAVIQEVNQETGLNIAPYSPKKEDVFTYEFEHEGISYKRKVHLFHVTLPAEEQTVVINAALNAQGKLEDKHEQFVWVTKSELKRLKNKGKLSGNSQQFEKVLGISET